MKLITVLENLKNDENMFIDDKVNTLFGIAGEYDIYETLDQIVKADVIDDVIRDYMNTGSTWERIAIFLAGIKVLNQEYYYLDSYENLENLTTEKLDIIIEDFIEEIKDNGLENEEIQGGELQ